MIERDRRIRLEALIADLKKLAAGWRPDAMTLAAAPTIEDWYADHYPGTRDVCLVGKVTGHPILGDQIVTTSPMVAIDPQYQWARSHSRFYRLGKRAQFKVIDRKRLVAWLDCGSDAIAAKILTGWQVNSKVWRKAPRCPLVHVVKDFVTSGGKRR